MSGNALVLLAEEKEHCPTFHQHQVAVDGSDPPSFHQLPPPDLRHHYYYLQQWHLKYSIITITIDNIIIS